MRDPDAGAAGIPRRAVVDGIDLLDEQISLSGIRGHEGIHPQESAPGRAVLQLDDDPGRSALAEMPVPGTVHRVDRADADPVDELFRPAFSNVEAEQDPQQSGGNENQRAPREPLPTRRRQGGIEWCLQRVDEAVIDERKRNVGDETF